MNGDNGDRYVPVPILVIHVLLWAVLVSFGFGALLFSRDREHASEQVVVKSHAVPPKGIQHRSEGWQEPFALRFQEDSKRPCVGQAAERGDAPCTVLEEQEASLGMRGRGR